MFQLRDYQVTNAQAAKALLDQYKIAYLANEMRVGKTLTSLETARLYGAKMVLFVTTIKNIKKAYKDFGLLNPGYDLLVINYEQLHNVVIKPDLIIVDEAHKTAQFPIPSKRTELLKKIATGLPIIYLSGTPTPESDPQIFHQLWISSFSPFAHFANFYKWAKEYVFVEKKKINGWDTNDYSMNSNATVIGLKRQFRKDSSAAEQLRIRNEVARVEAEIEEKKQAIRAATKHLFISFSQAEAGFTQEVQEEVIYVQMKESTYYLAKKLVKDKVCVGNDGSEILGDTPVLLKQKLQQIYSGAVLDKKGNPKIFDDSKARVIAERFEGMKMAIFYKFAAELAIIKSVFGNRLTDCQEKFEQAGPECIFCCQIQSGREAIDLSTGDVLIMFNIDFSAVSYLQVRARLQSKNRTKPALLYWLFAKDGIEEKIYQAVKRKEDYTLRYFMKDFNIKSNGSFKQNTRQPAGRANEAA